MSRLPSTQTSLLRYLRQQKRVVTRLANSTPYALSGTSVVAPGLMKVDERLVAGTPGGSRVELDSAGLRKYAADGTTVQVDLTGEVAAFSGLITGSEIVGGEIKTAVDGNRIEVTPYGVTGGEVRFYTGHPAEASPGKIWTEGWQGDPGYQVGMLQVVPPRLNTGFPPTLYLESGKHDTDSALDYTKVSMNATFIELGSTGSGTKEIFLGAGALNRRFDMAESFVGALSRQRWGALQFFVVDSSLPWSSPGSLAGLLANGLSPTVAAPLLVWDTNATPGQELKYTTNGTSWTVIGGGGGGGTTLFADPNADRLVFWDDSAGAFAALTASTGLTLTGTDLTVRAATDAQTGIVELATSAEAVTGTDTTRAVTAAGVKAAIDGTGPAAPLAKQQLASLSIPNAAMTTIVTWATFVTATGGMVGQASGVKVPVAGVYAVGGGLTWAGNATGRRIAGPTVNGVVYTRLQNGMASTRTDAVYMSPAPGFVICAANDVISLGAYQDSGAALALTSAEIDVWQIA